MDPQVYRLITIAFQTSVDDTTAHYADEQAFFHGIRNTAMELFAQFSAFYPDQFNDKTKIQFLKDLGVYMEWKDK